MGIVTDGTCLRRSSREGRDPGKVRLGDIMSTKLVSVEPNDGLTVSRSSWRTKEPAASSS